INAIIPNETVDTLFVYHLISNTKEYIQNFSTQSMKGMLSKGVFESIPFIFPPLPLQQKFARIVEKVEYMRQSQSQSKQQIEDLSSTLMQKAFRGEI
ncbi:MAG: restriction endonuclease subunit S, partial [Candidatus Methanoperedens sp.]|nr:restriction endonuclease subunit S [Candidatus Methanoperedens sp.]